MLAGMGHLAFLCAWKGVQLCWLIPWSQIIGTFQYLVEHRGSQACLFFQVLLSPRVLPAQILITC